ncbi:MAG: ferric reductase-like transmembrane domain-containing protein [bacterium]
MHALLRNVRFHVLCLTGLVIAGVYLRVGSEVPEGPLQVSLLAQDFGLLALGFLYISLLVSPLYEALPTLPWRGIVTKARRATGFSVFILACFHLAYSFFGELGGFSGLPFLDNRYLFAITCSGTALVIVAMMASTSFDYMVRRLGKWWKRLHRLVYAAGVLLVLHALLLGSDFADLATSPVAKVAFVLLAILLFLEALRVDKLLERKYQVVARFGFSAVVVALVVGLGAQYLAPEGSASLGINIHSAHIQLAQQAQQSATSAFGFSSNVNLNSPAYAGLRGDKTKRYTVSFSAPAVVKAGQPVQLAFKVYDASSGYAVSSYSKVYSQYVHLVIVNEKLDYFSHIHPDFVNGSFVVTTALPADGLYHLYVNYQPFGAIEQQQAFTLAVGTVGSEAPAQKPDNTQTKTFGDYKVSLQTSAPLKASELSVGSQTLTFTIQDAATGKAVTDLRPYLEAFGHLVMIREDGFDYLHVHPNNLTIPAASDLSGPTVTFLPLGLYGPIHPGTYRLFAEFNPAGHLFVADFTINVQ